MDQNTHNPEVYNFRQYDRIWQRVAPNLEPYPGMIIRSESAAPAASARASGGPAYAGGSRSPGSGGWRRHPCRHSGPVYGHRGY